MSSVPLGDALLALECNLRLVEAAMQDSDHKDKEKEKAILRLERVIITCQAMSSSTLVKAAIRRASQHSQATSANGGLKKEAYTSPDENVDSIALMHGFERRSSNETDVVEAKALPFRRANQQKIHPTDDDPTTRDKVSFENSTDKQEADGIETIDAPICADEELQNLQMSVRKPKRKGSVMGGVFSNWKYHKNGAKLTNEEHAAAKKAFDALDTNTDGTLSPEELFSVLSCMGITPSSNELHDLLKEFDANGDGSIGFDEFINMMVNIRERDKSKSLSMRGSGGKKGEQQPLLDKLSSITELVSKVHKYNAKRDVIGNDGNIMHPEDPMLGTWELFISVLLGITLLTMPLSMAFEGIGDATKEFDLFIDICFLLDVVKNFNSGFINEDDVVIMDRHIITRTYSTSWFLPDLLSSIPFSLIVEAIQGDGSGGGSGSDKGGSDSAAYARTSKTMKLLRLIRLAKLLRLLRVNKVFKYVRVFATWMSDWLKIQSSFYGLSNLLRLGFAVWITSHWIGCLNFMICRVWGFPEESWVARSELHNASTAEQYTWSFFKALLLMISIGFQEPPLAASHWLSHVKIEQDGSISEWCAIESWFTLICLYIGTIFYAVLISEVSSIIIHLNRTRHMFLQQLQNANEYMAAKKLPFEIRDKVRDFYKMQFEQGMMYNETEILRQLPPGIRKAILQYNSRELVRMVPMLSTAAEHGSQFVEAVATSIKPLVAFAGEVIFEEDTTGTDMFFIYSGVVEIISKHYKSGDTGIAAQGTHAEGGKNPRGIVTAIGNGCYFGDVALFYDVKRTASTHANTLCLLFAMSKESLILCNDYPQQLSYMKMVARYRLMRMKHVRDTGEIFHAGSQHTSGTAASHSEADGKMRQELAQIGGTASPPEDPDEFQSYMLSDPEDAKTELLLVSSMLGKYERYVMGDSKGKGKGGKDGGKKATPIYLQKYKAQRVDDHVGHGGSSGIAGRGIAGEVQEPSLAEVLEENRSATFSLHGGGARPAQLGVSASGPPGIIKQKSLQIARAKRSYNSASSSLSQVLTKARAMGADVPAASRRYERGC